MGGEIEKLEITEAILAGERALESLQNARERLGKAKNWSLIDLFGGGLFTDVMKHSRLKEYLEEAKEDLRNFRRELSDVQMFLNLNLEISDFLKVTDIFLITLYLTTWCSPKSARQKNSWMRLSARWKI